MKLILNQDLSGFITHVTTGERTRIKESYDIWEYKGHNPMSVVSILQTEQGTFVAGIRDYVEPTLHVVSEEKTKGAALAAFAALLD